MLTSVAAIGAAAAIGLPLYGAFHRNSPIFGTAIGELPGDDRRVALTFDDGPNPEATPRVLDALSSAGVHATFFLLGKHVERWPAIARRVRDDGHLVGNHGYHHRKLHLRGPAYIRVDLTLGSDAITAATGERPRYFRAPHGFRNPWVTPIARSLDQQTVGWTLGVWDSDCPGADVIADRAVAGCGPGTILLLHDGDGYDPHGDRTQTAAALPRIIRELRARGYEFATLP